jgi:hypothetical protein
MTMVASHPDCARQQIGRPIRTHLAGKYGSAVATLAAKLPIR